VFGGCCACQSLFSNGPSSVTLHAGQQYWILSVANSFSDQLMWNLNSLGVTGPQATSVDEGLYTTGTSVEGAFRYERRHGEISAFEINTRQSARFGVHLIR
jgi:asparagine synthetase A